MLESRELGHHSKGEAIRTSDRKWNIGNVGEALNKPSLVIETDIDGVIVKGVSLLP